MPQWIHDRAMRLKKEMEKTYSPKKAKQVAFAVATQQAHATGKAPKKWKGETFGTPQGKREAKQKYDEPSKMKKSAEDVLDFLRGGAIRLTGGTETTGKPVGYRGLEVRRQREDAEEETPSKVESLEKGSSADLNSIRLIQKMAVSASAVIGAARGASGGAWGKGVMEGIRGGAFGGAERAVGGVERAVSSGPRWMQGLTPIEKDVLRAKPPSIWRRAKSYVTGRPIEPTEKEMEAFRTTHASLGMGKLAQQDESMPLPQPPAPAEPSSPMITPPPPEVQQSILAQQLDAIRQAQQLAAAQQLAMAQQGVASQPPANSPAIGEAPAPEGPGPATVASLRPAEPASDRRAFSSKAAALRGTLQAQEATMNLPSDVEQAILQKVNTKLSSESLPGRRTGGHMERTGEDPMRKLMTTKLGQNQNAGVTPAVQEQPTPPPQPVIPPATQAPPASPDTAAPVVAPAPTAAAPETPPASAGGATGGGGAAPQIDVNQLGALSALGSLGGGGGGFSPYTTRMANPGAAGEEDDLMNLISRVQEMAFQEKRAQYLARVPERNIEPEEEGGPMASARGKLQEVWGRKAGPLAGAAGLAAGYYGGREAVKALESRLPEEVAKRISKRVGAEVAAGEVPDALRRISAGTAKRTGVMPWWGRKEWSIGSKGGRPLVRGGVRWGLRAGLLGAGLLGAKALFGKKEQPKPEPWKQAALAKLARRPVAAEPEDTGGFGAEHPYLMAGGGALAGALAAPLLAKGVRALGVEAPDMSLGGAALGAGAGVLATQLLRRRAQRAAMRRQQAEMEQAHRRQASPFGYGQA